MLAGAVPIFAVMVLLGVRSWLYVAGPYTLMIIRKFFRNIAAWDLRTDQRYGNMNLKTER